MSTSAVRGVAASLIASALFGVISLVAGGLGALGSLEATAWRVVISVPLIAVFVWSPRQRADIVGHLRAIRRRPVLALWLLGTALMFGLQLWVFMWGSQTGHALDVSLGYFLLPLVMVLVGRFVHGDRLSLLQWSAAGVAAVGVLHEVVRVGGVSWAAMLVALGYPVYFSVRRRLGVDHVGGMWLEMIVLLPVALVILAGGGTAAAVESGGVSVALAVAGVGVLSGIALLLYILASKILTLGIFGLLSYAEPVFLTAAAIILGESIGADEWWTYIPIWIAVGILAFDGFLRLRRRD